MKLVEENRPFGEEGKGRRFAEEGDIQAEGDAPSSREGTRSLLPLLGAVFLSGPLKRSVAQWQNGWGLPGSLFRQGGLRMYLDAHGGGGRSLPKALS
ncbi:hypothetical protein ACFLST_01060 [Chloroflexota bacterium]